MAGWDYLEQHGLKHVHYIKRCAYDESPEPRIGKGYKMICTGEWLQPAASGCQCQSVPVVHIKLMDSHVKEDGKVASTGKPDVMDESGRYPPLLGHQAAHQK